jgi:hypothetical protein
VRVVGHVYYSEGQRRAAEPGHKQKSEAYRLMSVETKIRGPEGMRTVKGLIDSGSANSFVSRLTAKELGLEPTAPPSAQYAALNGQALLVTGRGDVGVEVTDSFGKSRGGIATLQHGDIHGYQVILGMDWLQTANPSMDFAAKTVKWRSRKGRRRQNVRTEWIEAFEADVKDPNTLTFAMAVQIVDDLRKGAPDSIPSQYADFIDVFSEQEASKLPEHGRHDLAIELTAGSQPPWGPLYPLSQAELAVLREYIAKMLEKGYIRPSKSPAGAPILFAKKKDGTLRLCVDYRALNALTIKNRHPLPLIQESLDQLSEGKRFTKLDMRDAYHRVRIREGDEWKTAFRTRYGHYEYTVMPFGLANAPATFQGYMNHALSDLIDRICVVYLDDVLIYSRTDQEHEGHVRTVLERLRRHSLYAKLSKCEFHKDSIDFLGFVIGKDGVSMEPERVTAIQDWPIPQSIRDIRVFIGFANYYRRFIQGFSRLAAPLNKYTEGVKSTARRKDETRHLGLSPEATQAFDNLKQAFITAPILHHFDPERPIRVETDASGYAISGIVSQPHDVDGKTQWFPVGYFSKKMVAAEKNYDTHDTELLAIVASFKHFRYYLEGARHQVEVLTDHENLQWFMSTKTLSRRQVRWAEWMAAFDIRVTHRPGKANGAADALSRRPDMEDRDHSGRWNNAEDASGPLRRLQAQLSLDGPSSAQVVAAAQPVTLTEQIQAAGPTDKLWGTVSAALSSGVPQFWAMQWEMHDNVAWFRGRAYVPEGPTRIAILQECHDDPLSGHFGFARTLELAQRNFYWPRLRRYVKDYVRTCHACGRSKPRKHAPYGMLHPEAPPEGPWEDITLDFITDLPPSRFLGQVYDSILVVVDRYTKMAHYVPCRKDITADTLAEVFMRDVCRLHGQPKSITSDRGPILTSKFWSTLCYYLGTRRKLSTAFHPQTDGQTERQNQTLEQYLRTYANFEQDNWARLLCTAEFAYNDTVHASTGVSPFQANQLRDPRRPEWPRMPQESGASAKAVELADKLLAAQKQMRERLAKVKQDQARYYNRRHTDMSYAVGDDVYLSAKNIRSIRPSKKLDHKYLGPYKVIKVVNDVAYTLDLPEGMNIHPTFHISLLEKAEHAAVEDRKQQSPQRYSAGEDNEYVVRAIRGQKVDEVGNYSYLVSWEGYESEEDSWELAVNISPAALRAYRRRIEQQSTPAGPSVQLPRRRGRPKGRR